MIKLSEQTKSELKENLDRGSWISWNDFLNLNVEDTIKVPSYNCNGELVAYDTITVKDKYIFESKYEEYPNVTMGHISGHYVKEYIDKTREPQEGGMSGVISVKTDEIEDFGIEDIELIHENQESNVSTSIKELLDYADDSRLTFFKCPVFNLKEDKPTEHLYQAVLSWDYKNGEKNQFIENWANTPEQCIELIKNDIKKLKQ